MVYEYIQSTEEYKGFTLKVRMYSFDNLRWHRQCLIYSADESIACCRTKKEAKDLIDHGCFNEYIKESL